MRLLIGALLLATVPTMAQAQAALDETQFRREMLAMFVQQHPSKAFKAGDEPLVISVEGKGDDDIVTINLHRIFAYCSAASTSATDCRATKEEFVGMLALSQPAMTQASLRVIVRDRQYVDYLARMEAESKERLTVGLRRPVGDDLFAILASDSEHSIALVGTKALADLKLDEKDAWAIATRQTRAILPPFPDGAKLKANATAYQEYPYASSIVAFLDDWTPVSTAAGQDLLMTVVSDEFVFFGVMPDGEDLERFRATVKEDCAAQQRCISPNVYRFRDGRWTIAPTKTKLPR